MMGENESGDQNDDQLMKFTASSRTGRRNAIPSLNIAGVDPATLKLAEKLAGVSTDTENRGTDTTENTEAEKKGNFAIYF